LQFWPFNRLQCDKLLSSELLFKFKFDYFSKIKYLIFIFIKY